MSEIFCKNCGCKFGEHCTAHLPQSHFFILLVLACFGLGGIIYFGAEFLWLIL
jgi:hypothetical protein